MKVIAAFQVPVPALIETSRALDHETKVDELRISMFVYDNVVCFDVLVNEARLEEVLNTEKTLGMFLP